MLGLSAGLWGAAPPPLPFAHDAALALDLNAGTARRHDEMLDPASVLSVSRATPAWSSNASGAVEAFTANTARLTDRGLDLGQSANRLHGTFPEHGTDDGAASTALAPAGLFSPWRIVSQGAADDARQCGAFGVTSSDRLHWRVRLVASSSGRCRLAFQLAGTTTVINGPIDALAVSASAAGPASLDGVHFYPDGSREIWGTWTPNADGTAQLALGPDSATIGHSVDVLGAQLTDAASDWIMGGAGTVSRAGDVCDVDLSGLDLSQGFLLRIDGALSTTQPSVEYARLYQAEGGNHANKLASYLYRPEQDLRLEQHNGWANQGMRVLGALSTAPFALVTAHGPNYVGGMLNGTTVTPVTSAAYSAPTRLCIGQVDAGFHLPMRLTRLAIYAEAPSDTRLAARAP